MQTPSTLFILAAVAAILSGAFVNLQLSRKPKRYSVMGFATGLGLTLAAVAFALAQ